ncbi:MAG TPA: DsrE family protein [Polyangia bacterium]|nr:DsrE family protein [Polyangia bacterium]
MTSKVSRRAAFLIVLMTVVGAGVLHLAGALAAPPAPKHRVVFHVNVADEARWQEVLTNVENVQRAFGPGSVEIEVVAHGAGIGLVQVKNTALRDRIVALERSGPVFAACSNTLRRQQLGAGDLTPGVKIVDSGVAELIRKQEEGFTYVKLGS